MKTLTEQDLFLRSFLVFSRSHSLHFRMGNDVAVCQKAVRSSHTNHSSYGCTAAATRAVARDCDITLNQAYLHTRPGGGRKAALVELARHTTESTAFSTSNDGREQAADTADLKATSVPLPPFFAECQWLQTRRAHPFLCCRRLAGWTTLSP